MLKAIFYRNGIIFLFILTVAYLFDVTLEVVFTFFNVTVNISFSWVASQTVIQGSGSQRNYFILLCLQE